MTILLDFLALTIGINYLLNVLWAKLILCLYLFKLLAGIYEEYIIIILAALLYHNDTSWDTCTIENVGRQTDDGVNIVLLLNEETANLTF